MNTNKKQYFIEEWVNKIYSKLGDEQSRNIFDLRLV